MLVFDLEVVHPRQLLATIENLRLYNTLQPICRLLFNLYSTCLIKENEINTKTEN